MQETINLSDALEIQEAYRRAWDFSFHSYKALIDALFANPSTQQIVIDAYREFDPLSPTDDLNEITGLISQVFADASEDKGPHVLPPFDGFVTRVVEKLEERMNIHDVTQNTGQTKQVTNPSPNIF